MPVVRPAGVLASGRVEVQVDDVVEVLRQEARVLDDEVPLDRAPDPGRQDAGKCLG